MHDESEVGKMFVEFFNGLLEFLSCGEEEETVIDVEGRGK